MNMIFIATANGQWLALKILNKIFSDSPDTLQEPGFHSVFGIHIEITNTNSYITTQNNWNL